MIQLKHSKKYANVLQNQKGYTIVSLRSDHVGEFENKDIADYSDKNGIKHNILAPRTLQIKLYYE